MPATNDDLLLNAINSLVDEMRYQNYNNNLGNSYRIRNINSRGGYGKTFGDVREMKYDNQYYTKEKKALEELIAKLGEVRNGDFSFLNPEDIELMERYGASIRDLEDGGDSATRSMNNLNAAVDDLGNKKYDTNFASRLVTINNLVNGIGRSLKNMDRELYGFVEPWAKADEAASKFAKTVAMTKAGMDSLRDTTIRNVVHSKIGIDYNMSTEELLAAQQSYVQGVGRNLRIDNKGQESLAAMHAVMGGRENDLAVAFENFGVGLEKTGKHAGEMFQTAAKHGISFEKLTDNVAKNIKIAQNYTFKNGLKGLESMAAKAAALKMDMGQVAALADKVSSVEGAIGVASKLQVLGGPFASMADPLGMMSEGLMDMEGLMDRVTNMIGGLGNFNKSTGQVEVSAFNKQRVKAAADAMGISYDQLMESVNAQAKRQEIEAQINKSVNAKGLNKDMQELIKNSATFNEEGKAGVSINGDFKTLDEITENDKEALIKETQDQSADIKDIARNVRSLVDIRSGIKKQKEANQAQMTGWLGESMKNITAEVGSMNGLLKALVVAQGISTGIDIFSIGMDIFDMFRGGKGKRLGKLGNKISNFFGKGGTKTITSAAGKTYTQVGDKLFNAAGKEIHGAAKESVLKNSARSKFGNKISKKAGTKITKKVGSKLGKKALTGLAKGGGVGIVGAGLDIATDLLVDSGKIEKGGTAHGAMNIGAKALEFGGLGAMFGLPGAAIGAAIGAGVGAMQISKIRKQERVDNKLESLGIERKGKYSGHSYKLINEALDSGKISNRMRRKLERKGDIAMLNKIDEVKKQKEEEKQAKKDRKAERWAKFFGKGKVLQNADKAYFTVNSAYFGGKAFGTEGFDENKKTNKRLLGLGFGFSPISKLIKPKLETGENLETKKLIDRVRNRENQKKYELEQEEKRKGLNNSGQQDLNGKIDLNITGTIKLVGANGKEADITKELIRDGEFRKKLSQIIKDQLNGNKYGNYIPQINLA